MPDLVTFLPGLVPNLIVRPVDPKRTTFTALAPPVQGASRLKKLCRFRLAAKSFLK